MSIRVVVCGIVLWVSVLSGSSCDRRQTTQQIDEARASPALPTDPKVAVQAEQGDRVTDVDASSRHVTSDTSARIRPEQLTYCGAFRLPGPSGGSNWEYSAYAMTYDPDGDPEGPDDGFPGSLFALGHDHHQQVSEISIPEPVISAEGRIEDLPVAATLQPFADVRGGLVGELEIPRAGLAYLPSADAAAQGRLHFCWGQHLQFENVASHGSCDVTLDNPQTQGLWKLADYTNYVSNDYLFEIPTSWSDEHLPGYRLTTGRFRDGHWSGFGPALLAYIPPDPAAPPPNDAVIDDVKVLLMYGRPQPGVPELEVDDQHRMEAFSEADEWSGGSWLTLGEQHAVVLVGTKGVGDTWYGFSNGVVYPVSGESDAPVPEVPPFPHDARGWWSTDISAQLLFFDPDELAAVAKGDQESWTPQPYAMLTIDEYLFDGGHDHMRYKRYLLGACCFDRSRGTLYVAERQVEQDEDRSLIHVFRLTAGT